MECKNTFTERRRRAGFTLIELMIATGISLVVATAIGLLAFFSSRSFVAMTNYMEMAQYSRLALDKMSLEIRQAGRLTAYATNSITFQDVNGNPLRFTYDSGSRKLFRISAGVTNTYLTQCDALKFWIYQHTVVSNTFECYSPAVITNARVVQVNWKCSRPILGTKATSDSVLSATIALRNR
jgi:prepilin-type N-terminal cleavage/methylation domain-containing protein